MMKKFMTLASGLALACAVALPLATGAAASPVNGSPERAQAAVAAVGCNTYWAPATDGTGYYQYRIPVLNTDDTSCTVYRGLKNPSVLPVQQLIRCHGIDVALDGSFGPATEAGLKQVQSRRGLVADGRYGPATRAKLGYPVYRNGVFVKCGG